MFDAKPMFLFEVTKQPRITVTVTAGSIPSRHPVIRSPCNSCCVQATSARRTTGAQGLVPFQCPFRAQIEARLVFCADLQSVQNTPETASHRHQERGVWTMVKRPFGDYMLLLDAFSLSCFFGRDKNTAHQRYL